MSLRKIAAALVLTACSSATHNSGNSGQLTGASAPRVAVEQFLSAVNAKDLQAMSTIWGTQNGPARETMERNDMEKREVILACYFAHDSARILGETAGVKGHRDVRVELKKGNLTRQTTFFTIKGPGDRWYVDNIDLASVRDFCGNPGA